MRASTRGYLSGFVMAVALTVPAFALAWSSASPPQLVMALVLGLGLVQMLVHLRWFLHLRLRGPGWQVPAMAFTVLIVMIMAGGTLWVMQDLNQRMM